MEGGGKAGQGRPAGGLRATAEDIQWLRLVDLNTKDAIPEFSASRLVALGLVEREQEKLLLTERGRQALTEIRRD